MKKTLAIIMSVFMIMLLAACGGGGASSDGGDGPVSLNMATGGTSGTYYGFCGVVAPLL